MNKLIDKAAIFIVSLSIYIPFADQAYIIVPVLIALISSAVISYLDNEMVTVSIFAVFLAACFFQPDLLFFVPLFVYDAACRPFKWIWTLSLLPLIICKVDASYTPNWLLAAFTALSCALKYRTYTLQAFEKDYRKLRDTAKEISMQLEIQNKELLEKQEYEINLATVTERNRIARDIHDNVGHLLSRSILQIGALLAVNKDEAAKESLGLLKNTLSEAMDSIRASVHDLHEKSIDLQTEIRKLIDGFEFCPVKFDYEIDSNLDKNIKHSFIAVVKESLSNIIKHSNATLVSIVLREHPAFYQLVIQDNGSSSSYTSENGIGIKNISDRISAIGGNINITAGNGFRIFISVPKT